MASSSCTVSEDHLLCSICLDVFTDPVSTSCGHNFCKTCLAGHWDSSNHCKCPLCNKIFVNRPDLSVNTFISETATRFRKSVKMNAHKHVPILKKHTLIDPSENLEDYICQKHERDLELFCKDDQICVCLLCTVTDHKTHNIIPVEEASDEMKANMRKTQTEVQKMIQDRLEKTEEIKQSLEFSTKEIRDRTAGGVEVFTTLMHTIERSQAELIEVMEKEQKAAERQAEEFIKDLEQEITELKRRDTELEQLSHTEDHLCLLKVYSSVCRPPHTKTWTDISLTAHSSEEIVKKSLTQLQKTQNKEFGKELQKLRGIKQKAPAVFWLMKNCMKVLLLLSFIFIFLMPSNIWISLFAVDVTLDPDTAHPSLILSDDGKQVTHGNTKQNLPDNPERFNTCISVLGKEGFSSGRFYYEMQVSGKTDWDLGVAKESINRKGQIILTPQNGFWTVWLRNGNEYEACADSLVLLSLKEKPQKVGVFVDYEEGLVSFYDVEARSHIYSFTGQTFTEKLYPYFSPGLNNGGKNTAPLIISDGFNGLTTLTSVFRYLAFLFRQI